MLTFLSPIFSSLRTKLFFYFLLFFALISIMLGFSISFYQQKERLRTIAAQLDKILLNTLYLSKLEQDFLLYDLVDTSFYQQGESENLLQHRQLNQQIKSELFILAHTVNEADLSLGEDIGTIINGLNQHEAIFNQVVKYTFRRGFKDNGLEGQMRTYAHAIEASENTIVKTQVLTLRRHEKDYLLRKDTTYVSKFKQVCQHMRTKLLASYFQERELDSLLAGYLATLQALVTLEKKIGKDYTSGLKGQLRQQDEELEKLIHQIQGKASIQISSLGDVLYFMFILVAGLTVVFGIVLSYSFANRVSLPIRSLSAQMEHRMQANFSNPVLPLPVLTTDEVGKLTQSFNKLLSRIQLHVHEIQDKSLMLEKQNQKLATSENHLKKLNAVKDKFFFIISHELKSPLCTIDGFLKLLKRHAACFTSEEIQQFAADLSISVNRVLELLSNLQQWSLSQSGDIPFTPVPLSVSQQVTKNVDLLRETANTKQIQLIMQVPEELKVSADPNMLDFIIRNLITNAIKFTQPEGDVRIWTSSDDSFATITVSDSGVGISEDDLKRLFRENFSHSKPGTANEKGTGFGLLLCRDFVNRNGGKILVQSQLGKGTSVSFTLPLVHVPELSV